MPRYLSFAIAASLLCTVPLEVSAQTGIAEQVTLDTRATGTPFPHFWEQMFGSGRAVLALRADYRQDMQTVQQSTAFRYVRFHAILDRDVGVYEEDKNGNPVYNWSYVDQIYDGLLAEGVRPFVEISFMPKDLASRLDYQPFWYQPIVSPPKSYSKWDALITAFAQHLLDRYGIDEVAQWYFEVWNEPNIDFWAGDPKQGTYFELYDHTARAIKAVNTRLRIGGPATAQAAWVDAMIAHAAANKVPLDFVSTHVYGNDVVADVFPRTQYPNPPQVAPHGMVAAAVAKVHEQIAHSAMPGIPLIWSEFNATYMNEQAITDSIYMGPWMASTVAQCDGLVQSMSYWTFSDVFEEEGVVKTPFYGGYGLIAERGIPKPAYLVFSLLHTLGDTRLPVLSGASGAASTGARNLKTSGASKTLSPGAPNSVSGDASGVASGGDVLATRRADGTLVLAIWNMAEPPGTMVAEKRVTITLTGARPRASATVRRVDAENGDTLDAWKQMGSPKYPSLAQIASLKKIGTLGEPEPVPITAGKLTLRIPSSGLAVVEVKQ